MSATTSPTSRARGPRDPVFLTLGAIKYGFQASKRSQPHRSVLGHTAYNGQEGVVFGANAPKPNRASLELKGTTVTSFIDPSKEEAARKAGWSISLTSVRRSVKATPRTTPVWVSMPGGWKYGWRMDTADFKKYGSALGLKQITASTTNVVYGVANPKPPRASLKEADGSTVSTFIAPVESVMNRAEAAGWTIRALNFDALSEALAD